MQVTLLVRLGARLPREGLSALGDRTAPAEFEPIHYLFQLSAVEPQSIGLCGSRGIAIARGWATLLLVGCALVLAQLGACLPEPDLKPNQLPVIDLGYELHQAISYNKTTGYYKFQNIRYAQPPTNELRFRAPRPPKTNRKTVQTGNETRVCPQGIPYWLGRAFVPIAQYSNGKPFSLQAWEQSIATSTPPDIGDPNAEASEDCLFLDVFVPRKVLEQAKSTKYGFKGVPVITWIHGGGAVEGQKDGGSDPSGILKYSQQDGEPGLVYVELNYRLGALGFLAGPDVRQNGDGNAGLLDQRLALNWVQKYIRLFGGDKDRVTALGESGGAASIMLQLIANNGAKAPFSQAILQSPAVQPALGEPENAYSNFLAELGVKSLSEARKLPSDKVIAANAHQIATANETSFVWTPTLDGKFISSTHGQALARGAFDKSVKVLVAYNSFEGSFFFDPSVKTNADFRRWLHSAMPGLTQAEYNHVINQLYPPKFDGSMGYVDQASRQTTVWGDGGIYCNALHLNKAFGPHSFSYEFAVTPGLHIQDLQYTFNDPKQPAFAPQAQAVLQQAIVSFALHGTPAIKGAGPDRPFPNYGFAKNVVNITETTANVVKSNINEQRCAWWQGVRGQKL